MPSIICIFSDTIFQPGVLLLPALNEAPSSGCRLAKTANSTARSEYHRSCCTATHRLIQIKQITLAFICQTPAISWWGLSLVQPHCLCWTMLNHCIFSCFQISSCFQSDGIISAHKTETISDDKSKSKCSHRQTCSYYLTLSCNISHKKEKPIKYCMFPNGWKLTARCCLSEWKPMQMNQYQNEK